MDKQYPVRQWAHGADPSSVSWKLRGTPVFGIHGAKIDKVFDSLLDSSIRIIPVRHEANAAFMAAAVGRITGKAGVALVTSGPGCSNLITGMATANSEGDPVVATGGAVKRADKAKQVHQSMDTVAMFSPVTKYAVEVTAPDALAEVVSNAFRAAEQGRPGSAFVSLPQDVVDGPVSGKVLPASGAPQMGAAPDDAIDRGEAYRPCEEPDLPARPDGQPAGKQQGAAPFAGDQPYSSHQHLSGRRSGESG